MKEIVEMNKRVLATGKCETFFVPVRGKLPPVFPEAPELPIPIQVEIDALRRRLNLVIPKDFTGLLLLGNSEPGLGIEFNDGAQTVVTCPMHWDSSRSIFEQFETVDWDKIRSEALSRSHAFDDAVKRSKQIPPALPSTKKLQRIFHEPMRDFVKITRKDASQVHVLIVRPDEIEVRNFNIVAFKTLKEFGEKLGDLMPFGNLVIAVVADGKPLPVSKIDELKQAALKELKEHMPISYAKATGTFTLGPEWGTSIGGAINFGDREMNKE